MDDTSPLSPHLDAPAIESGGGTWRFPAGQPLRLDSGATLAPLEIGY